MSPGAPSIQLAPTVAPAGEAVHGLTGRLKGTGSRPDLGAMYFGPTVLQALVGPPSPSARSRPRPRRGPSPTAELGSIGGRLQGCGGPGLAGRCRPGPPTPRSALPLPRGQGGRPTGREESGFSYATGPPRSWATPSGAGLWGRHWPAPAPSVAGGARGWIRLPSMNPSSRNERPQESSSGGHFDRDLLEATPGFEPGVAVLQTTHVRSASVH